MAKRIQDVSQLSKYMRPTQLTKATDLIQKNDDVNVSELTRQIREIRDAFNRDYKHEEERLEVGRRFLTDRLFSLYENLQNGCNAGSVLHVDAATRIIESVANINGLNKPVNKKPETKTDVKIQLVMGKPRK